MPHLTSFISYSLHLRLSVHYDYPRVPLTFSNDRVRLTVKIKRSLIFNGALYVSVRNCTGLRLWLIIIA